MARIERLGVYSFAMFQAVLMAHVGLAAGILYSVGGFFVDLFTIGLNLGTALAFGALVGMPVIFAAAGLVVGIVEAVLFNFFAKRYGGLAIDFVR